MSDTIEPQDQEIDLEATAAPVMDEVTDAPPVVTSDITEEIDDSPKVQQVTLSLPFSRPEMKEDDINERIDLPGVTQDELTTILDKLPKVNMLDSEQARNWAQVLRNATDIQVMAGGYLSSLEDVDADYQQHVKHSGATLMPGAPRLKAVENQNIQGERAVLRVMSHLGLGTLHTQPLWHSGFWLTFKAPTEAAILELNRQIFRDKIALGRNTYGLALSNSTIYTLERVLNCALEHVFDSTLKSPLVGTRGLSELIAPQDIPSVLMGFLCTMYANGFRYRRACTTDPEKCTHVVEEVLNISKLLFVNNKALTEVQKTHMSARAPGSKDLESIKRYQQEFTRLNDAVVTLFPDTPKEVKFTFHTSSVSEYVEAGHKWISGIVGMVDTALTEQADESERSTYIQRHAQATAMRQYSHWIKSIELATNIIDDRETVDNVLNVMSQQDDIREKFLEEVLKYIDNSTVAVIGIPTFDCPVCQTEQSDPVFPSHKNIIPLDMLQVFFDLVTQRLERLRDR